MILSDGPIKDLAQSNGWNLISLPVPVPPAPLLEQAVGYRRGAEARYLALWWEACGDEVMVSDGSIAFTGHWPGYLAYVRHRCVFPYLIGFNLGSSEGEAEFHLVIDRVERTAHLLPSAQAGRLLALQLEGKGPCLPPQVLSLDELEDVIRRIAEQWRTMSKQDGIARMAEDQMAVQALCNWLDRQETRQPVFDYFTGGASDER